MGLRNILQVFYNFFLLLLSLRGILLIIFRAFLSFIFFKKKIYTKGKKKYHLNSFIEVYKQINACQKSFFFFYIDYLSLRIFKNISTQNLNLGFRLKQTSWNFYNDITLNSTKKNQSYWLFGIISFWNFIRLWVIGVFFFFLSTYYLLYIRALPINKILFEWILIIMFLYWIMSGFVFFIKKYQYSKFTSVIQRFWKRSYILFWLIESGVFLIFFYLTINASNEPVYMYDSIRVYKSQLFSWRLFLLKIFPLILLILLGYYIHLSLKWNIFSKISYPLTAITLLLIYIVWLEFYQFFHIINFYGNLLWVYDPDEFLWNLEIEFRRTRIINNYINICLMAKFWHLIFIFIFWVFFILRVNEIGRIRYPLFVANMQNFIILYIMAWLYMLPWLKFIFKKFLSINYYWFYSNFRSIGFRVFFVDIKLFFFSFIENILSFSWLFNIQKSLFFQSRVFFYWHSLNLNQNQFKSFFLRDYFIEKINEI